MQIWAVWNFLHRLIWLRVQVLHLWQIMKSSWPRPSERRSQAINGRCFPTPPQHGLNRRGIEDTWLIGLQMHGYSNLKQQLCKWIFKRHENQDQLDVFAGQYEQHPFSPHKNASDLHLTSMALLISHSLSVTNTAVFKRCFSLQPRIENKYFSETDKAEMLAEEQVCDAQHCVVRKKIMHPVLLNTHTRSSGNLAFITFSFSFSFLFFIWL